MNLLVDAYSMYEEQVRCIEILVGKLEEMCPFEAFSADIEITLKHTNTNVYIYVYCVFVIFYEIACKS